MDLHAPASTHIHSGAAPTTKKWVWIGAAAVAGIVGYSYYRSRSALPAPVADSAANATDPAYDSASSGAVYSGSTTGTGGGYTTVGANGTNVPTTNAQWTQQAISLMSDQGYTASAVSSTLGKYLARQQLTATDVDLVNAARAMLGPPPVGDFPILMGSAGGGPTAGQGSPTTSPTGLHATGSDRTTVTLAWNALTGATGYDVQLKGRANYLLGTAGPSAHYVALSPGNKYSVRVRAKNVGGAGPWSGYITVTTKK